LPVRYFLSFSYSPLHVLPVRCCVPFFVASVTSSRLVNRRLRVGDEISKDLPPKSAIPETAIPASARQRKNSAGILRTASRGLERMVARIGVTLDQRAESSKRFLKDVVAVGQSASMTGVERLGRQLRCKQLPHRLGVIGIIGEPTRVGYPGPADVS
jgi:hypothetical protein